VASAGTAKVAVEGLNQLRRDLKAIAKEVPRELSHTLKSAAGPVVARAASMAPRRTGALAASVKASASGTRASIRSAKPYANVIAWGGTTGRGHKPGVGGSGSVRIKASRFPERAAEQGAEQFLERLADGVDGLLVRHGFK
jgi:phage gpG-like protein